MEAYVDGGGYGMRPMSAEAVRYNTESMSEFKTSIDGLIEMLTSSEADKGKMKSDPVVRGQFGGGGGAWAEASGVYDSYNTVLSQLTDLSGLLRDCLEGLGIAVVASKDGFEQMDDDVKQKMINIHQRTDEAKAKADREAGRVAPDDGAGQTAGGDSSLQ
ncbi:hypothetical protein ACFY8C_05690 [Streptomyces flavochromogenes]|uniref:WXG100 family type VII secretion target n=1 Tax=Streptomyces flavochromogenes TaxID=68199 RepID=A0ABW6XK41_9ACTN|nr:hypothetical protein [Streptomyces flavochromogenes]